MVICYDPDEGKLCDFEKLKKFLISKYSKRLDLSGFSLGEFSFELSISDDISFIFTCFCNDKSGSINVYRKIKYENFFDIDQILTVFINFGTKEIKNVFLQKIWDDLEVKVLLRYGKILSHLKPPFVILYKYRKSLTIDDITLKFISETALYLCTKIE